MRKLLFAIVLAIILSLATAIPALAHNECSDGNGVQRYSHTHGQPAKHDNQLCLPAKASGNGNSAHGTIH